MTFQFYIELQNSSPLVWRRIIVPADYTFYQLHMAIQGAFGWENCHLFSFSNKGLLDKVSYGIPDPHGGDDEFIVKDAAKSNIVFKKVEQDYKYLYDFGDGWEHKVVLEKITPDEIERPYCVEGAGACPPEDVGGMHGYSEMLEAFNSPGHAEQASYIEWLGLNSTEKWDAAFCSVREVNKRLALLE